MSHLAFFVKLNISNQIALFFNLIVIAALALGVFWLPDQTGTRPPPHTDDLTKINFSASEVRFVSFLFLFFSLLQLMDFN